MSYEEEFSQFLEKATQGVQRMQEFDPESLRREAELGKQMHLGGTVKPAKQLVWLYQQINLSTLKELPLNMLQMLDSDAVSSYACLDKALKFQSIEGEAQRAQIIQSIRDQYQSIP